MGSVSNSTTGATNRKSGCRLSTEASVLQRLEVRGFLVLQRAKAEADIERGGFRRLRSQANRMKIAPGVLEQPSHQSRTHGGTADRPGDVEVPDPTNPDLIGVAVAVKTADRDQVACPEGTEEYLPRPVESIGTGAPLGNELVNKAEAFRDRLDAKILHLNAKITKRYDVERCGHAAV